jgi:hypothetical protein
MLIDPTARGAEGGIGINGSGLVASLPLQAVRIAMTATRIARIDCSLRFMSWRLMDNIREIPAESAH